MVIVECPRCGRTLGVIEGYTEVRCTCPPKKPGDKKSVVMTEKETA